MVLCARKNPKNKGGLRLKSHKKNIRSQNLAITTSFRFGNWKKPRTWSNKAHETMNYALAEFFACPIEPKEVYAWSSLIKYYGEDDSYRAVELAKTLSKDIYQLDVLPMFFGEQFLENEIAIKAFDNDLITLLEKYGSLSIIYTKGRELNQKLLSRALNIGGNVLLVPENVGMPVGDYLIWLKGCKGLPSEILKEWSGISSDKQEWVYQQITTFFRYSLITGHQVSKKYLRPMDLKLGFTKMTLKSTNVSIDFEKLP